MRLCLPEYFLRRAAFRKGLQDLTDLRTFRAGIELAVRECSGAALPELHIRFRIKLTGRIVMLHITDPLVCGLAALQQDRLRTRLREYPCGKQSRRPRADHDRPVLKNCFLIHRHDKRLFDPDSGIRGQLSQDRLRIVHRNIRCHDEMHIASRIGRPPNEPDIPDILRPDMQPLCRLFRQHRIRITERQRDIRNAQQLRFLQCFFDHADLLPILLLPDIFPVAVLFRCAVDLQIVRQI